MPTKPLFLLAFLLFRVLSFSQIVQVLDEQGGALPGVLIYTENKAFLWSTNERGEVDVSDWNRQGVLHFSFLGYAPLSLNLEALEQVNWQVQMLPLTQSLEAVVVVGRRGELVGDVMATLELLSRKTLLFSQAQHVPDALEKESGVFVQKSQMGGGSPIVRGFEANRILLVVDGVKLNNAIYRSGHLQNSLSVDAQFLDRIELIYGPGSLEYGSDALGGVLHFRTRSPRLKAKGQPDFRAEFYSRFSTANFEKTVHFNLNKGFEKWAWLSSVSFSSFGDLRSGSRRPASYPDFGKRWYYAVFRDGADYAERNARPDVQRPTAYSQMDLGQKVLWMPRSFFRLSANMQFSNTTNIPRYDQLAIVEGSSGELKFAEWHYGPQTRLLLSTQADWEKANVLLDRARLILAWQYIHEERIRRRFNRSLRMTNTEELGVFSVSLDLKKNLANSELHQLAYGTDLQANRVHSTALGEDVQTEAVFDLPTRYPDGGSRLHRGGAYALYRWHPVSEKVKIQAGLRYAFSRLQARYEQNPFISWPQEYLSPGVSNSTQGWSYGLGIHFPKVNAWQFKASFSTAFRAPNVDDLGKIRAKNGKLSIPNPNLKPERTASAEFNLGYTAPEKSANKAFFSVFYTRMRDLMVRRTSPLPDGRTSIVYEGELLQTVALLNEQSGFVYGLSANASLALFGNWSSSASFTWMRGRVLFSKTFDMGPVARIDTLLPLAHVPPPYGRLNVLYEGEKWQAEAVLRFHLAKAPEEYAVTDLTYNNRGMLLLDRLGTSDNLEYTPSFVRESGEVQYAGALPWRTLNFYFAYSFGESFQLFLALENVFDLHYRTFSSGLSAPGFNTSISLLFSW